MRWRIGAAPEPEAAAPSFPGGRWNNISWTCDTGRHFECAACDCQCHPPPDWCPVGRRSGASVWRPDWCIAPDATLREWMTEHRHTPATLARRAGCGEADIKARLCIQDVLDRKPLLPAHAEILEKGTGVAASFWLALERDYRGGLAAGLTDASEPLGAAP